MDFESFLHRPGCKPWESPRCWCRSTSSSGRWPPAPALHVALSGHLRRGSKVFSLGHNQEQPWLDKVQRQTWQGHLLPRFPGFRHVWTRRWLTSRPLWPLPWLSPWVPSLLCFLGTPLLNLLFSECFAPLTFLGSSCPSLSWPGPLWLPPSQWLPPLAVLFVLTDEGGALAVRSTARCSRTLSLLPACWDGALATVLVSAFPVFSWMRLGHRLQEQPVCQVVWIEVLQPLFPLTLLVFGVLWLHFLSSFYLGVSVFFSTSGSSASSFSDSSASVT